MVKNWYGRELQRAADGGSGGGSSSASAPAAPAAPSGGSPASSGSSGTSGGSTGGDTGSSAGASAPATALDAVQRAAATLDAGSSPASPGQAAGGVSGPASSAPARSGAAPTGTQSPPQGPVPYDRHEAAIRNAREQARSEMEQELGWARTLGDRQRIERAIAILDRLDRDAHAFHRDLGSELNYPGPEPQDTLDDLVDPEPDLRDQTGTLTAFSAEANRQIVANAVERARRAIMAEVAPALEFARDGRAEREVAQINAEGRAIADSAFKEMETYPHFKDNVKAIGTIYSKIDPRIRQKYGTVATLLMAYNKFMAENILPTLGQQHASETIADLQRSAVAGSTAVSAAPAAPQKRAIREGNVDDLAARMREIAGAQAAV